MQKQNKWLIGGVIAALLVVIGVVTYAGVQGNWFSGSVRAPGSAGSTLNLYVDSASSATCTNKGYAETCPLHSIKDAVDEAYFFINNNYTFVNINIAHGTYNESGNITLKDKVFKIKGDNSRINNKLTFTFEVGGLINGLIFENFHDISKSVITANYSTKGGNSLAISDILFTDVEAKNVIALNGGSNSNSVTIKNTKFYQNEVESVIKSSSEIALSVENSTFAWNTSSQAEISAYKGLKALNNLFINSKAGTKSIIKLSNGAASTIANNTFYNNKVYLAAADKPQDHGAVIDLKQVPNGAVVNVKNNIVANSDVLIKTSDNFVYVGGNIFIGWKVAPEYDSNQIANNFNCAPVFEATGSSSDASYYKLKAGSTCGIDQGWTVPEVTKDYFGTSRPQGTKYDIGFYELKGGTTFNAIPNVQPQLNIPLTTTPVCGNGTKETGELCDDGNKISGDGCSSTCTIEIVNIPTQFCGNGAVNIDENCDDGNTSSGDGCSSTCDIESNWTCSGSPSVCNKNTTPTTVACGNWSDVSSNDTEYTFWIDLCENGGIVQGNEDGTLKPDSLLTRAELLALAFRASDYKNVYSVDTNAENCFNDVGTDWYANYFCTAKDKGFVQGYAGNVAKPGNKVVLAEGLKMFLGALDKTYSIDEGDCWYCSMIWSAKPHNWLPYSFVAPTDIGGIQLTRRKAFNMLWRVLNYE